jgi:hypothetical protein
VAGVVGAVGVVGVVGALSPAVSVPGDVGLLFFFGSVVSGAGAGAAGLPEPSGSGTETTTGVEVEVGVGVSLADEGAVARFRDCTFGVAAPLFRSREEARGLTVDAGSVTSASGAGCSSIAGTFSVRVGALQSIAAPKVSTPSTRNVTAASRTGRIMPVRGEAQGEA